MPRRLPLSRTLTTTKGMCRWCGEVVPKGRYSWCSDKCVDEYRCEAWPARTRQVVFQRDHGVCSICGRDCERLHDKLMRFAPMGWVYNWQLPRYKKWIWIRGWLIRLGLVRSLHSITIRSLWEHDHIVPVIHRGLTQLANLRTLCVPCHKAQTRKLAAERAAIRKKQTPRGPKRLIANHLDASVSRSHHTVLT